MKNFVEVRYDQSNDSYHRREFDTDGNKSFFSSTQFKLAQHSLLSFQHNIMGWTPSISTAALKGGTRWHDAREAGGVSEWEHRCEVVPPELERKDGTLRSSKEVRDFMETFEGKEIITHSELQRLRNMEEMFMRNPAAKALEERADTREVSIRVREEGLKFGSKARYDMRTIDGILCDYKTTSEPFKANLSQGSQEIQLWVVCCSVCRHLQDGWY